MRTRKGYDLNTLLIITNFSVCAIAIILYYNKGENKYVNLYMVMLLCLFGAQNLLMLLYERKKRDPFIIILITFTSAFYMLRILTLLNDPWSSTLLDMYSFTHDDLNYSLMFIMLSNVSIFLGLSTAGGKTLHSKNAFIDGYPANSLNVILILLFALVISLYIRLASDILGRFAGYITGSFVKLNMIQLLTFVYLAVNFKKLSNKSLRIIVALMVAFVIFVTLAGSRSGILTLAYLILIVFLSVKGRITLNRKSILIGIMLVFCSFYLFISATYIRQLNINEAVSTKQLTLLKEADFIRSKDISLLCRPIFDRIGFLDYATILIRNPERFGISINFIYYFKSIVDNALTPGFNVFDTPRVSHSLSDISRGESVPTQKDITAAYQSNMLTVYGEYYVLFHGYPALITLFLFSYIFKKIYLSIRNKDAFLFYLYRALVLFVFYLWLNSFGLDWMLLDLIGIFITVGLFKYFYKMRRRKLKYVYSGQKLVGNTPI